MGIACGMPAAGLQFWAESPFKKVWATFPAFLKGRFEMKRVSLGLFALLLVTALAASFALAGPCPTIKTADGKVACDKPCPTAAAAMAGTEMGECCVNAALAGKGCCGKTAAEVKAAAADCPTVKAAKAEMHACCVEALDAGKGCCGKDAKGLKTDFAQKVMARHAVEQVKAGMHPCCAEALDAGKGCCGKDAAGLKADFKKKVESKEKKLAST